jgi:hypothetical protein
MGDHDGHAADRDDNVYDCGHSRCDINDSGKGSSDPDSFFARPPTIPHLIEPW